MAQKLLFIEGEKVLAYHGPLLYEAKIMKSKVNDDSLVQYLIHYVGWSKTWDEWLEGNKILKWNKKNIKAQKKAKEKHEAELKAKKRKGRSNRKANTSYESKSVSNQPTTSGNDDKISVKIEKNSMPLKAPNNEPNVVDIDSLVMPMCEVRLTPINVPKEEYVIVIEDSDDEQIDTKPIKIEEDDCAEKKKIEIEIPDELQSVLKIDFELITKQRKLLKLPSDESDNVHNIIEKFVLYKKIRSENWAKDSSVADVAYGIRDYFNYFLSTQLLYESEHKQLLELVRNNPNVAMAKIYGPVHLLRLFVRLTLLWEKVGFGRDQIQSLVKKAHEFLAYLVEKKAELFGTDDYVEME